MKTLRRYNWLLLALGVAALAGAVLAIAYSSHTAPAEKAPARTRRRRWLPLGVVAVVVVAGGLVGGAFAYDAVRDPVMAPGVRVGNVEVAGLTAVEAERKLERAYRTLRRPVVVHGDRSQYVLLPEQAGVEVHIKRAVARALKRSRRGWFLSRAVRDVAGWKVEAALRPRVTFAPIVVTRFAEDVQAAAERPPRDASVIASAAGLQGRPAEAGLEVDGSRLRRLLARALTHPRAPRRFSLPVTRTPAAVTTAELAGRHPVYLTVDRTQFKLRLYERLKLARTFTIAVGAIGYDTPSGLYRIQNKTVDPVWSVPNSPWTGSLAGAVIPPGPSNPLKARWLGISGPVGIHGTDQDWSLGSAASHGCIRMAIPDVIELYERVPVGTPVYIG